MSEAIEPATQQLAQAAESLARKIDNLPISEASQAKEAAEAVSLLAEALWWSGRDD